MARGRSIRKRRRTKSEQSTAEMASERRISRRRRTKSEQFRASERRIRRRLIEHDASEIGYKVDTAGLLFTPERNYLVKNNGHEVRVDELKGKSIVLFIFPLGPGFTETGEALNMIQVYNELLPLGGVEFVFVPVHAPPFDLDFAHTPFESPEDLFQHLFYTLPFPAIPLSDIQAFDGPVMKTFGLDASLAKEMPYWVVIDPSDTVVFTRLESHDLFNLFGGAELHPLSRRRICSVVKKHWNLSTQERINRWDQLLASPHRDHLLSSNGTEVPISSLKGKVIGLYFCDNVTCPPSMPLIKNVYEDAKLLGLDFEIVQINFPWHSFRQRYSSANPTLLQRPEDICWLTLPFKDPSCRKLQRIFPSEVFDDREGTWRVDCLVIIDARQAAGSDVPFEFAGVGILKEWGVKGYPFTRPSLFDIQYKIQKREVTLQSLFPPGECLRQQSGQLVDASKLLSGKKVFVLFFDHTEGKFHQGRFVSMLESFYRKQEDEDVAEEDKFEVVYVSTLDTTLPDDIQDPDWKPSYLKLMKGMPWLAHPHPQGSDYLCRVFKGYLYDPAAALFDSQGKLIAKADSLDRRDRQNTFPFISRGLKSYVRKEVNSIFEYQWGI